MKQVKPVKTNNKMSVNSLIKEFETAGFNARRLSESINVLEKMIKDKECNKFLGVAGAMVPAGMKQILIDMILDNWFDVLVITPANLTHDLIEHAGSFHYIGTSKADDKKLNDEEINRIYDVFMPNKAYEKLEDWCKKVFSELPEKLSVKEFLWELGKRSPGTILHACYEKKVPVFCPAISDSGLGMQVVFWKQEHKLSIDAFDDLRELVDIAWTSKKAGALLIGGGVPKNHIIQSLQFTPNSMSYAVQITTDRPESGGLSGAELREGISWGKLNKNAEYVDLICDATIALPIISACLKERLK